MEILNSYNRKESIKGIALIQVLLITSILSILALYLSATAKQQIKISGWANDKAQAIVNIHSAESELVFSLLTEHRKYESNNRIRWNFFGSPFFMGSNVIVKMQDQSGLLHAHYPEPDRLKSLLLYHEVDINRANQVVDSLLDWQDVDSIARINGAETNDYLGRIRNGDISNIFEIYDVKYITPSIYELLKTNMTIHRRGSFNPTTAPKKILAAITNDQIAEQVINLREKSTLSDRVFEELTGLSESDTVMFYPSNIVSIDFHSTVGDSQVNKSIVLRIEMYAKERKSPVNILSTGS